MTVRDYIGLALLAVGVGVGAFGVGFEVGVGWGLLVVGVALAVAGFVLSYDNTPAAPAAAEDDDIHVYRITPGNEPGGAV